MRLRYPPKFICDEMLLKLSRWLRIIGFDVTAPQQKSDKELAEISEKEDRTILTRDKDLSNRKGINAIRIRSDALDEQLKQILKEFPIDELPLLISRCPSCNGELLAVRSDNIDKNTKVDRNIPLRIVASFEFIYLCTQCTKSYWTGTHWDRITNRLQEIGVRSNLPCQP